MLTGHVESADSFGNLLTNIHETDLPPRERRSLSISTCQRRIAGVSHCYSDHAPGSLLALIGSSGRLEIAVANGNAEKEIKVAIGAEIRVELPRS